MKLFTLYSPLTRFCLVVLASASLVTYVHAAPTMMDSGNGGSGKDVQRSGASQKSHELNEKGASYAQKGQFEKAEQTLRESVSLDSKNLSAIFNLGSVLIQRGKLKEAIYLLDKHAKAAKTDAGLYARLGDAYFSSEKIPEAQAAYEKALQLDPTTPKIAARLGTVYSLRGKLEPAIEQFLHAVKQEPQNTEYLGNLVSLYIGTNKPEKAVSTAKRALQVGPSKELYVSLGAAYELQGEWKNSLIAYQRAKDLGDSSDELEEKIEALEKKTGVS